MFLRLRSHCDSNCEVQLVMRTFFSSIASLWLCIFAFSPNAQPDLSKRIGTTVADTGAPGYRFEQFDLSSKDSERHYRVHVAIPTSAPPKNGFPSAYLLDGNAALMDTDAELLGRLSKASIAPVIVYVAYDNDLRIDSLSRAYDYTPALPSNEPVQHEVLMGRRSGGANDFLALIEHSIIPKVELMANIDSSRRALWGHSYGGLFTLYTLYTKPQLFSLYAPVDPSLWWGDGYILQVESNVAAWQAPTPHVHIWTGHVKSGHARSDRASAQNSEAVTMMQKARQSVPADATAQMVTRQKAMGLNITLHTLPGLSHGETLAASLPLFFTTIAGSTIKSEQSAIHQGEAR